MIPGAGCLSVVIYEKGRVTTLGFLVVPLMTIGGFIGPGDPVPSGLVDAKGAYLEVLLVGGVGYTALHLGTLRYIANGGVTSPHQSGLHVGRLGGEICVRLGGVVSMV